MSAIIGIDIGATTSEIAYLDNGKPRPIKNKMFGTEITPSIVGLNENVGEMKVGKMAENYPSGIVGGIQRFMGESIEIKLGTREYSPVEIGAMTLKYLKDYGEDYLDDDIKEVVIAVPVSFSGEAIKAVEQSAELAGLKILKTTQEPIAAALAFELDINAADKNILVFDFGGRTLSVSMITPVKHSIELVDHYCNQYLGGICFDARIIEYMKQHLRDTYMMDNIDENLEYKLITAAKKAKEQLSCSESVNINIPFIGIVNNKIVNFELDLTREKFEELTEDLVEKAIACVECLLQSTGLEKTDIYKVLLVGGSTRMPAIKDRITNYFGFTPSDDVEPDLAVSFGAAIKAGMIKGISGSIQWM